MPDAEWCWSHHPDHAEERRRRASRGSKRGGRGRPQAELAEIKQCLSNLADDVLEGRQDKGIGAVASQILNVYLRAVSVELKAREQLELIERLEALAEIASHIGQLKGEAHASLHDPNYDTLKHRLERAHTLR